MEYLNDEVIPWDKPITHETTKRYKLFCVYRDTETDNRSVREVAKKFNVSPSYVGRLSSRFNWVKRARDYDTYLLELERRKLEEARIKAKIAGVKHADLINFVGLSKLNRIALKIKKEQANQDENAPQPTTDKIKISEAVQMIREGHTIQSDLLGLKEENINIKGQVDNVITYAQFGEAYAKFKRQEGE